MLFRHYLLMRMRCKSSGGLCSTTQGQIEHRGDHFIVENGRTRVRIHTYTKAEQAQTKLVFCIDPTLPCGNSAIAFDLYQLGVNARSSTLCLNQGHEHGVGNQGTMQTWESMETLHTQRGPRCFKPRPPCCPKEK